ncbi:hypothetical protein [Actinacidiphila sp. ITFR-21]|uniref:hypothetical protein n=1 Tax=Actinacidiphila sp. ITFR-21 TaxID=3075199 RepID=UPI00288C1F9A|nr:hypothetical protein [Streptomyces sp. ITFR-21]WNI16907.1 hypothetical protein RLT57_16185 [Streptomyces sp. ITFR-21]
MPDIADILAAARPRETVTRICTAGDVAAEVDALTAELARVSEDWEPGDLTAVHPGREVAAKLADARERMRAAEVEFRFRYIGDRAYQDLLAAHPPADHKEAFDPASFPPALIAASCIDPVMTEDQARELFEVVNEGQIKKLFDAAWDAHNDAPEAVPFSLAASALLAGLGGEK